MEGGKERERSCAVLGWWDEGSLAMGMAGGGLCGFWFWGMGHGDGDGDDEYAQLDQESEVCFAGNTGRESV